mgnify:CR=1 FL=1
MEFLKLNMTMREPLKKLDIYWEDRYILAGLLIGIKIGKQNQLKGIKINLDS